MTGLLAVRRLLIRCRYRPGWTITAYCGYCGTEVPEQLREFFYRRWCAVLQAEQGAHACNPDRCCRVCKRHVNPHQGCLLR